MKKVELKGKLSLNKVTVAKLNDKQMNVIKGGELAKTGSLNCNTRNVCTTGYN